MGGEGTESGAWPGENQAGEPAGRESRPSDGSGNFQPTRSALVAVRGETKTVPNVAGVPNQHYNSITSWGVDTKGEVKHVYA